MSVNSISDVINRLQRMRDSVEEMSATMDSMRDDYRMENKWSTIETDDYEYALYKAYMELDDLSACITHTIENLEQVRYA